MPFPGSKASYELIGSVIVGRKGGFILSTCRSILIRYHHVYCSLQDIGRGRASVCDSEDESKGEAEGRKGQARHMSAPTFEFAAAAASPCTQRRGRRSMVAALAAPSALGAILLLLHLLLLCAAAPKAMAAAASSSMSVSAPPPSSSYEDVRQLDKYGHSVQLRHAAEASKRHGRLVVAVSWDGGRSGIGGSSDNDNDDDDTSETGSVVTMLCTPLPSDLLSTNERQQQQGQRQHRHVLRFTGRGVQRIRLPHDVASTGKLQQLGSGSANDGMIGLQPLVCVLNTRRQRRRGPAVVTAVACSGLASDAAYVQNQLLEAAKVAWDKYDAELGCPAVLAELQHLCRAFWRHPTKAQWTWKPQQPSGDDDDENQSSAGWARPLGVTTLVVQHVNSGVVGKDSAAQLYIVEPSGIVQHASRIDIRVAGGDGADTRTISSDTDESSRFSAKVACIGRDGPAVQARLEKALKERMVKEFGRSDDDESTSSSTRRQRLTQDEMLELIRDAIHDRQPGWGSPSSPENEPQPTETNPSSLMYVEVLSSRGAVDRKVVVVPTAA
jgi:hypothetical protein